MIEKQSRTVKVSWKYCLHQLWNSQQIVSVMRFERYPNVPCSNTSWYLTGTLSHNTSPNDENCIHFNPSYRLSNLGWIISPSITCVSHTNPKNNQTIVPIDNQTTTKLVGFLQVHTQFTVAAVAAMTARYLSAYLCHTRRTDAVWPSGSGRRTQTRDWRWSIYEECSNLSFPTARWHWLLSTTSNCQRWSVKWLQRISFDIFNLTSCLDTSRWILSAICKLVSGYGGSSR